MKKTRQSNVEEKKVGGSFKIRPSIIADAKAFIAEDNEVKSFNALLEKALVEYIATRKKIPRENGNQAKMDI